MRTGQEAREWLARRVPRETTVRLDRLADLVRAESSRQNLVSKSTLDQLWLRHIADSAQLIEHAPQEGAWLDLGSGAGFPGLVVAAVGNRPVTLVEERRLRADFLRRAAAAMEVEAEVVESKLERMPRRVFDVISARAFAPLPRLLGLGTGFSTTKTVWLLPKGKNAARELEALDPSWQGDFRLEPSLTDPEASIIVAEGVRRRAKERIR